MKKVFLFAIIVTMLSCNSNNNYETPTSYSDSRTADELEYAEIIRAIEIVNSTCPYMLDEITRMDGMALIDRRTIQYKYTIIEMTKEYLDLFNVKELLKPDLVENVRTNPDLKYYRVNQFTFRYQISDINGSLIELITITPTDYLKY
jgi:hypothetical protein